MHMNRIQNWVKFFVIGSMTCAMLWAQKKEEPVGLVLVPGGGKVLRSNTETPLDARSGDILFSGDVLRTGSGFSTVLYCPAKVSATFAPSSEVSFSSPQFKMKSGKLSAQITVNSCALPTMVRVSVASQQHYGVSMVRGVGVDPSEIPEPRTQLSPAIAAQAAVLDQAISGNPADVVPLISRAVLFESNKMPKSALADYRQIARVMPDAVWTRGKIFDLEETVTSEEQRRIVNEAQEGKIYAILVGVSQYQKLPQDYWLHYADADAESLAKLLGTPRGGAVPASNITLLTNTNATTAAIRTAIESVLRGKAGKKDTVMVLIAGHGLVETPSRKAFILSNDSDPQDLTSTALPMADIQALVQEASSKIGRLVVFVDVCRAGAINTAKSPSVNSTAESLAQGDGEVFGLVAARPKEFSREGPEFGGGHGAFSYYLLKGLNGEADTNHDGIVNVNELIAYVTSRVPKATDDKQHPRDFGTMDNAAPLSYPSRPGLEIAQLPVLLDSGGNPALVASIGGLVPPIGDSAAALDLAIRDGQILPNQNSGAFAILAGLREQGKTAAYQEGLDRLRVALEDRAQQVLLHYLEGDEIPQNAADFVQGARYTEAARQLTSESVFLDARSSFFKGRSLLFEKRYAEAASELETAIRLDPGSAYAYNALGIAYLEQGKFEDAAPAFHDAMKRAPHWIYPLHNLALASVEAGDYTGAISYYETAMKMAPDAAYIPYNLGLVYQRMNRSKEAEAFYRKAMVMMPNSPQPYNALGAIKVAEGKAAEAEVFYREALKRDPQMLAAKHNLALLLVARKPEEAIELHEQNLSHDPEFMPSRLALADLFKQRNDVAHALDEYRRAAQTAPDYAGVRLALAGLLEGSGRREEALTEVQAAMKSDPGSPVLLERAGDLERALGRTQDAQKHYQEAEQLTPGRSDRKRLQQKASSE
jgi:tetratricopeptide (TPR) repeat protein